MTTTNLKHVLSAQQDESGRVRPIAFYLPQYHPIPENNEWWGDGFTEWTNVKGALPKFRNHYQPHVPSDLGYYDLRDKEARQAQVELARQFGIYGFCYYHYWFQGKRLLERPLNEVLASGEPDFPFCLCWANESWSRRWDGQESVVLMKQDYSPDDDLAHIQYLLSTFEDPRYIRVNNKPLLIVWRASQLPDSKRTTTTWRNAAERAGFDGLYLVKVENWQADARPESAGFDAAVEFAPDWRQMKARYLFRGSGLLKRLGLVPRLYRENLIADYQNLASSMLRKAMPDYKRFLCATPMWDNSARRPKGAYIFKNSTPDKYEGWLREITRRTIQRFDGDERLVFINAWNEWAEGCHLEPDQKYGLRYLEATRRAVGLHSKVK